MSVRQQFQLQSSDMFFFYLIFIHLFALLCVWFITPWFLFIFFLVGALISFFYYLWRDEKIITLQHDKKTEWILQLSDDSMERAELLPSSVMMRYFLVLHFKCTYSLEKKSLILFSDSFSDNDFKSLRRCVKMGFL